MSSANAYLSPLTPSLLPKIPIRGHFTIGRAREADLSLNSHQVANLHATIEFKDDRFHLSSHSPQQPVLLNGAEILHAYLRHRDAIQIGDIQFDFIIDQVGEATSSIEKPLSKNIDWCHRLHSLRKMATTNFPILLTGESGTGKDVVARMIHEKSEVQSGPFITINCSAITGNLLESELFGHVKGSFTGALNDRKGAFESARGGTLFLDEIGDLPIDMQPKLLRALENQEIRPVGSDRTIKTDVRIVSATHKNLDRLVKQGKFRLDLLYRLNVLATEIPALRNRTEDIEDLIYFFAKKYSVRFSFDAIEALKNYTWPGNIRELKNLVAKTSAIFPHQYIRSKQLVQVLPSLKQAKNYFPAMIKNKKWLEETERELITEQLRRNKGNQRKTASELGIPKSTLHDRIRAYGIDVHAMKREAFHNEPLRLVSGL